MCFSSTLISCLFLASAALAGPLDRSSQRADIESYNRAGVMIGRVPGTFRSNAGTITIPAIEGLVGSSLYAWLGMDSDDCNNFIRAGVTFTASQTPYTAWYQWVPNPRVSIEDFPISAGDPIHFWIILDDSMSSGRVMVANDNDRQGNRTYDVKSNHTLCGTNVEWFLEDDNIVDEGPLSPTKVGAVTFTNAMASGPGGQYWAQNGSIIDMVNSNVSRNMSYVINLRDDSFTIKNPL